MIGGYLWGAPPARGLVLVDAEVGPTTLDLQMLGWLRHVRLPHRSGAAEADQVKPGRQVARRREVASAWAWIPTPSRGFPARRGKG